MIYTRTDTPDFSTRLSREELRVFTAVQGETALAAIVAKTRLAPELVEEALARLVARKLLRPAGGDAPPPPSPTSRPPVQPPTQPPTGVSWLAQRRAAEAFLELRMGRAKALPYLVQLGDCVDERAFADTVRALAKKLSLIVDADIGRELLGFLEP